MKPTALIIDDQVERHEAIEMFLIGTYRVEHAWSYTDATGHLTSGSWDVVYLDHDLADFEYATGYCTGDFNAVPQREMTGLDVASFITHMRDDKRPRRVVIHSWNPVGAAAMTRMLCSAGVMATYEPFSV